MNRGTLVILLVIGIVLGIFGLTAAEGLFDYDDTISSVPEDALPEDPFQSSEEESEPDQYIDPDGHTDSKGSKQEGKMYTWIHRYMHRELAGEGGEAHNAGNQNPGKYGSGTNK